MNRLSVCLIWNLRMFAGSRFPRNLFGFLGQFGRLFLKIPEIRLYLVGAGYHPELFEAMIHVHFPTRLVLLDLMYHHLILMSSFFVSVLMCNWFNLNSLNLFDL